MYTRAGHTHTHLHTCMHTQKWSEILKGEKKAPHILNLTHSRCKEKGHAVLFVEISATIHIYRAQGACIREEIKSWRQKETKKLNVAVLFKTVNGSST